MAKKKTSKKIPKNPLTKRLVWIAAGFLSILVLLIAVKIVAGIVAPDKQCLVPHERKMTPPQKLETAQDFFDLGNYNYETGHCHEAIENYSSAIKINPMFTEAYNNRAYTNMRMQNFTDALQDLDHAIALRPDYVNALMNRGDIYNYYYAIDRNLAMKDYNLVLSLGPEKYKGTSLCGHRLLAQNNGWNLTVFFALLKDGGKAGCH